MFLNPGEAPGLAQLWRELGRSASGVADPASAVSPIPAQIADAINRQGEAADLDRAVIGHLTRLAVEIRDVQTAEAGATRQLVSELIAGVRPERLRSLISALGGAARQREFLQDATRAFAPETVLTILLYAASGPAFSPTLRQLLFKLTAHAILGEPHLRTQAELLFREQVLELFGRWWAVDETASAYGFDEVVQSRAGRAASGGDMVVAEHDRLVQISLEVDAVGVALWAPVTQMVEEGRFRELLDMLKQAPAESRAASIIVQHLATPRRLSALLQEEPVDFEAVDRLLAPMGVAGAKLLLDELCRSEVRATRRGVFDRLARMGSAAGPVAVERLQDGRWYVQRNVLALLAEIGYWPDQVPLDPFLGHRDARVRREALKMLLQAGRREQALNQAFRDDDRGILQWALAAAGERCPDSIVPVLVKRLADPAFPADLRVPAVRALGGTRSTLALESLLRLVHGGKSLLGRIRLAPKSPEMLAALCELARRWAREPRAAELVALAAGARDAEVRGAASPGTTPRAAPAPGNAHRGTPSGHRETF